ncbi:MAG: tail assembly protein [Sphingomonadaceae bacterium]
MKTIVLLGELGKRYGRRHRLDVASPAEAVRAMCANFKDFAGFVSASADRNVGYRVITAREDLAADELHQPAGKTITIAPVIAGAGGSVGKIILGAALIAAAIFVPALAVPLFGTTTLATVAFSVGVSLALGGVAQMLAPVPQSLNRGIDEDKPSYIFNGAQNTTAQGQAVPVGYGRMIVGSAVISAGINVEDYVA